MKLSHIETIKKKLSNYKYRLGVLKYLLLKYNEIGSSLYSLKYKYKELYGEYDYDSIKTEEKKNY